MLFVASLKKNCYNSPIMQERLWDILNYPVSNNTAQTVIVKLSDGTSPFLFLRDPIAKTWMVFRESERDITNALDYFNVYSGLVTGEGRLKKVDKSNVKTIFPDVQLVEVESESVFIEMLLPRAKEEANNIHDPFDTRVIYYKRLIHLLEKDIK